MASTYYKPEDQSGLQHIQYAESMPGGNAQFAAKYAPPDYSHMPPAPPKKRRYCGMTAPVAILAAIIVVLVVAGTAAGVAVGVTKAKENSSPAPAPVTSNVSSTSVFTISTSTANPTATKPVQDSAKATTTAAKTTTAKTTTAKTTSTSATATATAVTLISANYGGQDVTDGAKTLFTKDKSLSIETTPTIQLTDPWVNQAKAIAVLHRFGDSIRTFVATENTGSFTLEPGDITLSGDSTQEITKQGPTDDDFAIVSVVWGRREVRDQAVYDTIYRVYKERQGFTFSNTFFGVDTWEAQKKSGVIWYTTDGFKTFKSVTGREDDNVGFGAK